MAASAAHTVSLSSAWKLHDSSPELCHQQRERKKKKNSFSFRGLLFWRRFFRRSRPFMQRDASKWPRSLQWSSAAPWLKMNFLFAVSLGPVAVCGNEKTEEFKVFLFLFYFWVSFCHRWPERSYMMLCIVWFLCLFLPQISSLLPAIHRSGTFV